VTTGLVAIFAGAALLVSIAVGLRADSLGRALRVMDIPDGRRKRHRRPTPLVGGLAVLPAVLAALLVPGGAFFSVAAMLTGLGFLLGFLDDRAELSARWRFAISVLAVVTAFSSLPEMALSQLDFSFMPAHEALTLAPAVAVGFTALVLVGLQNAVNMTDGKNGLVAGLCVIWCGFLAVSAPAPVPGIALVFAAALVPILALNLLGRLFLGDCGSYGLAAAIGLLAVYSYSASGAALPADTVALWFWVPVLDCLRLIAVRLGLGRSPMTGDRRHLHHYLGAILPWRYGLIVYLALVAAPGAAAIAAPQFTATFLLASTGLYAAIVAVGAPRRTGTQQKIS